MHVVTDTLMYLAVMLFLLCKCAYVIGYTRRREPSDRWSVWVGMRRTICGDVDLSERYTYTVYI